MSLVTIGLPVRNGERYLVEAVQSILHQTLQDFSVIVVLDGSTDNSEQILMDLGDDRFTILKRKESRGLSAAMNLVNQRAETHLVARMDADDVMLPGRLESQYHTMQGNAHVDVLGTWFDYIDKDSNPLSGPVRLPTQPDEIRAAMQSYTAIGHPTAMYRRERIMAIGGYDESFPQAQDIALWLKCLASGYNFANVPQVLLHYRQHDTQVSVTTPQGQDSGRRRALVAYGKQVWGEGYNPPELSEPQQMSKKPKLAKKPVATE